MTIQPDTLKYFRERHPMSQDALAQVSGVSKKTIGRIERGETSPTANTIERLASALGVKPDALSREPKDQNKDDERLREIGYRPLKTYLDGETALAFQMVEHLYGIPIRSQILMAPLFSALLAEGSLASRRERLDEIDAAAETLLSFAKGHLSFSGDVAGVTEGAFQERQSIESKDVFGSDLVGDWPNENFDPQERNPFADYLQDFANEVGAKSTTFDPDGFGGWKTPEGLPEYRIGADYIENLTGGDYWAEFALLRGFARIRDIPKHLLGDDATEARVEWLSLQVPVEERERQEKKFANIDIDLGEPGLTDTSNPSTKEE